mmetsp:Transcript_42367/g.109875  ORF Transcript_42367/g.109875 Transcript_42367/m.109875 type:complete len:329 (+) Transcript_42367:318-1304(+)
MASTNRSQRFKACHLVRPRSGRWFSTAGRLGKPTWRLRQSCCYPSASRASSSWRPRMPRRMATRPMRRSPAKRCQPRCPRNPSLKLLHRLDQMKRWKSGNGRSIRCHLSGFSRSTNPGAGPHGLTVEVRSSTAARMGAVLGPLQRVARRRWLHCQRKALRLKARDVRPRSLRHKTPWTLHKPQQPSEVPRAAPAPRASNSPPLLSRGHPASGSAPPLLLSTIRLDAASDLQRSQQWTIAKVTISPLHRRQRRRSAAWRSLSAQKMRLRRRPSASQPASRPLRVACGQMTSTTPGASAARRCRQTGSRCAPRPWRCFTGREWLWMNSLI